MNLIIYRQLEFSVKLIGRLRTYGWWTVISDIPPLGGASELAHCNIHVHRKSDFKTDHVFGNVNGWS